MCVCVCVSACECVCVSVCEYMYSRPFADHVCLMEEDWAMVDLASISKQTLYTMDRYTDREHAMIVTRE